MTTTSYRQVQHVHVLLTDRHLGALPLPPDANDTLHLRLDLEQTLADTRFVMRATGTVATVGPHMVQAAVVYLAFRRWASVRAWSEPFEDGWVRYYLEVDTLDGRTCLVASTLPADHDPYDSHPPHPRSPQGQRYTVWDTLIARLERGAVVSAIR